MVWVLVGPSLRLPLRRQTHTQTQTMVWVLGGPSLRLPLRRQTRTQTQTMVWVGSVFLDGLKEDRQPKPKPKPKPWFGLGAAFLGRPLKATLT